MARYVRMRRFNLLSPKRLGLKYWANQSLNAVCEFLRVAGAQLISFCLASMTDGGSEQSSVHGNRYRNRRYAPKRRERL